LNIQQAVVENACESHHKDQKILVAKEKTLWKELQMAQGKIKSLTLQIVNDWENVAIENKTEATLYDKFIE
jgi:hypothetical protein